MTPDLTGLPGEELICQGIEDLRERRESVESLMVQIGASRMRAAGLDIPLFSKPDIDAELRLYGLLSSQFGNEAYPRYNALLRRLISFERALECRQSARAA